MPAATVAFVLHAHLPDLRDATPDDSIESRWLFEALTDTYVPLLALLERLADDAIPAALTVSLSPILLSQLADARVLERYERHLSRMLALADAEIERTRPDPALATLALAARRRLVVTRERFFDRYRADLPSVLRRHAEAGRVTIMTTSATHAVLPLHLSTPAWVEAQVALALAEHERRLGIRPDGFWLPECAYDPALDAPLRRAGVRWVIVDTHGLSLATPAPVWGPWAPVVTPGGLVAFARDPDTARQVWSAETGYPADPWYRDYHRDLGWDADPATLARFLPLPPGGAPTGFKYHRVTGGSGPKAPYDPAHAAERVRAHAEHFVRELALRAAELARVMDRPPVFVCPYDAELFGHWWHEGIDWLEAVLRLLAGEESLAARSPTEELAHRPVLQQVAPARSSWGAGGHLGVWLSEETASVYPRLLALGDRVTDLIGGAPLGPLPPVLRAAVEHLLLAQASDWTFMIGQRTAADYGRQRLEWHLAACARLCDALAAGTEPAPSDLRADPLFGDDLPLWPSASIPYSLS